MLFHVSEHAGIEIFEPRWSEIAGREVVWAIDDDRLCNYLVPRECPRVAYYAGPQTASADLERFLGKSRAVIAVESGWFEQLRDSQLFCTTCLPTALSVLMSAPATSSAACLWCPRVLKCLAI